MAIPSPAAPPPVAAPRESGPGGRRRDGSRDDALRLAALQLLAETGYDGITMDAVAERARAGKGAIYRRWRGKADLVVDALVHANPLADEIDTGSLAGDLRMLAARMTGPDSPLDLQVIIGMASALPRDTELRTAFREQLIAPRMAAMQRIFQRAADRGEIPPVRNLELVVSLLPAVLVHKALLSGAVPDASFAQTVVDDVLLPLATGSPAAPRPCSDLGTFDAPEQNEGPHAD
jgi:AcrR family transcriptional regulator